MHLPPMIHDLAVILMVAGMMTLMFRMIRQPAVLGYIVAGFIVGPNFQWFPSVVDISSIKTWAEIGVIFLLFALGLEFSFKKLARVGSPASITAIAEVAGMTTIGYFTGKLFGWGSMDSLFLGGILAISSTTIIIRAFEELEMKTRGFVKLVFGALIVEDLVAILLMVMLSTIAVTQTVSGLDMGIASLKLLFFLTLWFVLGIFLIPSFLKKSRRFLKSETLLIVALGLCFLMVVLANKAGFSPALGAFIMGSILAETIDGEKIEHLISPVKDLFGAIFFVSIGMLIDPNILFQYATPIVVIALVTIFGKALTTILGALLAGQSLRHSVQAGMSLAQIGEFSFIIAGLGLSLNVTSDFLYPIAISVSAITTFTTPYLIRYSDKAVDVMERTLPKSWLDRLEHFRTESLAVSQTSAWQVFLKAAAIKLLTNTVVVIAIFVMISEVLLPFLLQQSTNPMGIRLICMAMALLLSAPFLWAIAAGKIQGDCTQKLWGERRFKFHLMGVEMARWVLGVILVAALARRIVSPNLVLSLAILGFLICLLVLPKYFEQIYTWLEKRFVLNLNAKELTKSLPALAPWDAHLVELKVAPESALVGITFSKLEVREKYGITIALIVRGNLHIPAPGRHDCLYPGDTVQVIGTDAQIQSFRHDCEAPAMETTGSELVYELRPIVVQDTSPYLNRNIRDSAIREQTQGLVVGIEKKGIRLLNPDSSTLIENGDILWIVGDRNRLVNLA